MRKREDTRDGGGGDEGKNEKGEARGSEREREEEGRRRAC